MSPFGGAGGLGAVPAGQSAVPCFRAEDFHLFCTAGELLRGVDLVVPGGRITALIGPSGAGKSMLLRSLNRMHDRVAGLRVTGGLWFREQEIYAPDLDPVCLRRRVGMVFRQPVVFPASIFDNVAYGPRVHRLELGPAGLATRVERCLRAAGLWDEVRDVLRQPAGRLTGGQRQRLAIARALAVDPEVLLLDEPTATVDPVATARIEDALLRLRGALTVVVVTHNLAQAARISQQTVFMLEGRVVESGPTEVVFHQPRDTRTEDYLTGRFG